MNTHFLRFFLALGVAFPFGAIAQDTLTLEKAIRISLENNYAIKIVQSRKVIAANNVTQGNAGFLPFVDASAARNYDTRNIIRQENFNPNVAPISNVRGINNNNSSAGVNLSWTIFDGLAMFAAYDQLREIKAAGHENAEITIENTVAQVSNAYYDVLRQQERLKLLKEALAISKARSDLARARNEVGAGSKVDFLSSQVDYNADSSALISQQQTVENTTIGLNRLLTRDIRTRFVTNDTIVADSTLSLETLRQSVLQKNPNLLLAQRNRNVAHLDTRLLKAGRFPRIDVLSGYNYGELNNGSGLNFGLRTNKNAVFNYGLRATVNVFNGFNQSRLIQNAKINEQINDYQIEDVRIQLDADLESAYLNYRNSLALLELEKQNYTIAQQNVVIALERYKVGSSTALELREVQRNNVAAVNRLIEASYNAKLAEIELLRLSSSILEDINPDPQPQVK